MKRARQKRSQRGERLTEKRSLEHTPHEVSSIEQFRAKYLPKDTKKHSAQNMTPEEIGAGFARESLSSARRTLTANAS
jgi:ribosomal protein S4